MNEWLRLAAYAAFTFILGYLTRYTEARSRLVHWWSGYLWFDVPFVDANGTKQTAKIQTHALTIQNNGWRTAKQIEIIHASRPEVFKILPAVKFTEFVNVPSGEHIITIESLPRREFVTLQVLTAGDKLPQLQTVRSEEGSSRLVEQRWNPVLSRPRRYALVALLAIGFTTAVYWAVRIGFVVAAIVRSAPAP